MENLSHGKEFDLQENEPVGETHFNNNGLARKLVLTPRQKKLGNGQFTQSSAGKP